MRVAELGGAGGFADDAVIELLVARLQRFDHFHRAVDGGAFFVRGDQQGDRAGMIGMRGDEALRSR